LLDRIDIHVEVPPVRNAELTGKIDLVRSERYLMQLQLPQSARCMLTSGMSICRLLNGMWQVSGAHGRIDPESAVHEMFAYHKAGFTTWDLADHYGPAEDFIGSFRQQLAASRGEDALATLQAFTKWVPRPGPMTRDIVEANINISRQRMGVDTIDLLQFHWWAYEDTRYLDALMHMAQMQEEGMIRHLALTNFDTDHVQRILDHGIRIVSNQVQYSLIDLRPEVAMVPMCEARGVQLLTYGTLCGGLLSDAYIGQPEPRGTALSTVSLRKYKQMVDAWGGWGLFQELLAALKTIADKHGVSIANVATRAILDRPTVAGVIIGVRLGIAEHRADNARVFDCTLDDEDQQRVLAVLAKSHNLYRSIGDCGDEYRR
jgi:aryl-alcohol dehydrogenase-like predicted oxidoreductase